MYIFESKTKVIVGRDSIKYLQNYNNQSVLIITDDFLSKSEGFKTLLDSISGNKVEIFTKVVPDPPMECIEDGVEVFKRFKPNIVIAFGGGSPIDAAKCIKLFSEKITDIKSILFIAIPTTSGTGSEVTSYAVVTKKQEGKKYPLVSDDLLPDIAIVDSQFVDSLPPKVIADTGMDVLTHSIEAYVSKKATDISDAFAIKSIIDIFSYLKKSYDGDMYARDKIHTASTLAGLAFNIAGLGLNHAIAHNVGARLKIPHGRINAMLLPHIVTFNSELNNYESHDFTHTAIKLSKLSKILGFDGINVRGSVKALVNEIIKLEKSLDIPLKFSEMGITTKDLEATKKEIIEGALKDGCLETNPILVEYNHISNILDLLR